MKLKTLFLPFMILTLNACAIPVDQAPLPTALPTFTSQPALPAASTFTAIPVLTQLATITVTLSAPSSAPAFCDDPHGRELINSFNKAIANKDGALLSALISPSKGMDVRFYRDGNIVNYDVEHAKFVFETTFQANWGLSYGSGETTLGSFQEIILPALQRVFTSNAVVVCNQLKVGGTTYQALWPYQDMNYFSVYFPGTEQNGGLDWETWAVGVEYAAGKPYLTALMHFVWEP